MKTVMYTINIKQHKSREELRRRAEAIFTVVATALMAAVLALASFGLGAMWG